MEMIDSARIIREKRFQMRMEIDRSTVARYVQVLWTAGRRTWRTCNAFQAIQVAKVGKSLFLVDGFHRLAAMEEFAKGADGAGRLGKIRVDVIAATEKEALLLAAKANLRNGLPLKKSEIRNVFRAYMDANGNVEKIDGKPALKSYRAIAADLGGLCSHMTARNWMLADYSDTAEAMGDGEAAGEKKKPGKRDNSEWADAAIREVKNARARFSGNPADVQGRRAVLDCTAEALHEMKKESGPEPEPEWMDGSGAPSDF